MPLYEFAARTQDSVTEELGIIELHDDADAQSFAGGVIRDLMGEDRVAYQGWTLQISEENRPLASIPFDELYVQKG